MTQAAYSSSVTYLSWTFVSVWVFAPVVTYPSVVSVFVPEWPYLVCVVLVGGNC
jgi:hypothetical protein